MSLREQRTRLSREGRDTLWLVGMLALCIVPHATHVPWWCIAGVTGALTWRTWLAVRDAALPPRWVLLVVLAGAIVMTLITFKSIFGREAGVTLVSILAGLKTLELRARRDAFVVTSLGFFLILTQFLYSQSMATALLMAGVLWGLVTSLVLAQRPLHRPTIGSAMGAAGRTLLMGLPVMLVLYLLFPRIGPLWAVPADAQTGIGLSDHLTLGKVAELAQDDGIAMRIQFDGPAPSLAQAYFRGPVLELFDGRSWLPRPPDLRKLPGDEQMDDVRIRGEALSYHVTLEANPLTTLPMLEGTLVLSATPPGALPGPPIRQGLNWLLQQNLTERVQLHGQAWLDHEYGPPSAVMALGDLLQLPPGLNPRTLAWARNLHKRADLQNASPPVLAQAVMQHIGTAGYVYTLSPGDTGLREDGSIEHHLIDQFWLDRKTGFCEHFATAFVVVMRAMGVPARVITGYQGMERNPVDGLFVVRNNHAHAWAEYWQPGQGWTRADPTAAVSPDRIEHARPLAKPKGGLSRALPQIDSPLLRHAKALLEATNHRWNTWVMEYSRGKQLALLEQLGWNAPDWTELVRLCAGLMAALSALGVVWLWLNRPKTPLSPWTRHLRRIDRALQKSLGLPPPSGSASPAPALTWHQHLSHMPVRPTEQASLEAVLKELAELDALQYGPPHASMAHTRQHARQIVARIEQLAKQWRQTRSRPHKEL